MVIVQGFAKVDPAHMPAARALAADMIGQTRAEPGCLEYSYAEDLLEPGVIRVAERWESQAALEAHFKTLHMAVFNEGLAKIGVLAALVVAFAPGPNGVVERVLVQR
jgi:quinol monooxygenase YgiN